MIDTLIDEILAREGAKDTNNPNDAGGRTKYGISERWDPDLWVNGPPTVEQARQRYLERYITAPGFLQVKPDYLQQQLIDFGVVSGPTTAIQVLQRILGVPIDGKLGPVTLTAIGTQSPMSVNNRVVLARVLALVRLVQKRPSDLTFLYGWITRAMSFLRTE